ncbi:MAG: hypothetical protein ACTSYX_06125 [Candidatus Thorarchaeota archaeon]
MLGFENAPGFVVMVDFQFPMSDVVAVIPYVLPMLFIGLTLLLYQRHLDPKERVRNLMVLVGVICLIASFLLLLYAGFGSVWWGPPELTFGSWWAFVGGLQFVTDIIFGSVAGSIGYVVLVTVLYVILARSVISPPDPDFVALRNELKEAREQAKTLSEEINKLEGEKKTLTEYLNEREDALKKMEEQLASLKEQVAQVEQEKADLEAMLKEAGEAGPVDREYEQELLETISKKDQTITRLQSEIEELKSRMEAGGAPADAERIKRLEERLRECEARFENLERRAETAVEVTDSVISDLAELITQIESSGLDPAAKIALTSLIEGLGRAVGRISAKPEEAAEKGPRVELIGAVMMVHEIVDGVKRLTRGASSE